MREREGEGSGEGSRSRAGSEGLGSMGEGAMVRDWE